MLLSKGWLENTNDLFFDQLFQTVATKGREITLDDLKETYEHALMSYYNYYYKVTMNQ